MIPILSVVIPTLGRPIVVRTLESLAATDGFERVEVLLVGQLGDPAVAHAVEDLVAGHPNIRHLPLAFDKGDSSEKKNAGARAALCDIVAFIDDDVVVARDWPEKILAPFSEPAVGLISGPSLVPDDVGLMARLAGVTLSSKAAGYVSERYNTGHPEPREVKWSRLIGCNMAYRRSVLAEAGWFDPAFWPGEEMIAAFKATRNGHKLVFQPQAYLYHYPRASLWGFVRQVYGYGATRIRLIRSGVEFEPSTIVPMAFVGGMVGLLAGGIVFPALRSLLGWLLLAYVLVILGMAVDKFRVTREGRDLLIFFLIPVMHIGYGVAEWVELFRPGKDLSG